MLKALIINGPNLNLLGKRKNELYPKLTLEAVEAQIKAWAKENRIEAEFFQSNCEGALIEAIQEAEGKFDFLVINPGAYTHYSYAIRDAIEGVGLPAYEVHLTNLAAREEFRQKSVIAPVCRGSVIGFAEAGYIMALMGAKLRLEKEK